MYIRNKNRKIYYNHTYNENTSQEDSHSIFYIYGTMRRKFVISKKT